MVVTTAGDDDFRTRIAPSLLPGDQDCTTVADLLTDIYRTQSDRSVDTYPKLVLKVHILQVRVEGRSRHID